MDAEIVAAAQHGDAMALDQPPQSPRSLRPPPAHEDRPGVAGRPIGDAVGFATKPELARQMMERAIEAGMPFGWVAAAEAYGQSTALRERLEDHGVRYVLAVPKSFTAATAAGARRADELAHLVPAAGWQQISCGRGQGPRFYDWPLIATASPVHHLLMRRSLTPPTRGERELAFFTCHATPGTTLAELVRVAGTRWPSCRLLPLKRGPAACGQLSRNPVPRDHHRPAGENDLIALTAAEIRRLLTIWTQPCHPDEHYQRWSRCATATRHAPAHPTTISAQHLHLGPWAAGLAQLA